MFNFWKRNNSPPTINNDTNFQKVPIGNHPEEVTSGDTGVTTERSSLKNNPERVPIVRAIVGDKDQVVRGLRLRFTEDARYNLELLRNLAPTAELIAETISLGNLAPKEVFLIYLGNIANLSIVAEVKQRIKTIKARTLYESSYIQRNIEDSTLSPFPQVEASERPDVAVSALFQGRIVIILDGSARA